MTSHNERRRLQDDEEHDDEHEEEEEDEEEEEEDEEEEDDDEQAVHEPARDLYVDGLSPRRRTLSTSASSSSEQLQSPTHAGAGAGGAIGDHSTANAGSTPHRSSASSSSSSSSAAALGAGSAGAALPQHPRTFALTSPPPTYANDVFANNGDEEDEDNDDEDEDDEDDTGESERQQLYLAAEERRPSSSSSSSHQRSNSWSNTNSSPVSSTLGGSSDSLPATVAAALTTFTTVTGGSNGRRNRLSFSGASPAADLPLPPRPTFAPVACLEGTSTLTKKRNEIALSFINVENYVSLSIDGQTCRIAVADFHKYPDTMLGRMFGSAREQGLARANSQGSFALENTHIAADALLCALSYYRNGGTIVCPPDLDVEDLVEACEYLMIDVSLKTISCRNLGKLMHVLSNRGAANHFIDTYFPQSIAPVLEKCVMHGDRQAYLVFLYNEDIVKWDESQPPPFDENIKKGIMCATKPYDCPNLLFFACQSLQTLSCAASCSLPRTATWSRRPCRTAASKRFAWALRASRST